MRNSTTEEYGRLEEEMQIWMTVNRDRAENYKQRMRLRQSENQEGAKKMSGGRDTEIQRDREGKKKTNVSPRGLTLSFLFGEEWKKEDFHLLSSQAPFDISLFLSHILISLVSIHHAGTLVELAKALAHMANLAGHKSLSVALFLPLFFSSLLLGNFT